MDDDLAKIGDVYGEIKPSVFELIVYDHVSAVHPITYGLTSKEYPEIDPAKYFVTSGDAVEKAKVLEKDYKNCVKILKSLACELLMRQESIDYKTALKKYSDGVRPKKPKRFADYDKDLQLAAKSSKKMLDALLAAKGEDCFLETEWDGHRLLCIPKNPRSKND